MCFNECVWVHVLYMYVYLCVSLWGCVCVRAPQRDQWAGTWPCQYSWSLCVFSERNHGNGAVQTGCLHWGFESHNVATALSFIMPWITVTSQQMDTWTHFTDRIGFQGYRLGVITFPPCRIAHLPVREAIELMPWRKGVSIRYSWYFVSFCFCRMTPKVCFYPNIPHILRTCSKIGQKKINFFPHDLLLLKLDYIKLYLSMWHFYPTCCLGCFGKEHKYNITKDEAKQELNVIMYSKNLPLLPFCTLHLSLFSIFSPCFLPPLPPSFSSSLPPSITPSINHSLTLSSIFSIIYDFLPNSLLRLLSFPPPTVLQSRSTKCLHDFPLHLSNCQLSPALPLKISTLSTLHLFMCRPQSCRYLFFPLSSFSITKM